MAAKQANARDFAQRRHAVPEFVRRGILGDVPFRAGRHVDLVDAETVGGKGEARLQLFGVFLGLADAFGVGEVSALGLDHRQLVVAVGQHIVGDVLGGSHARTLQSSEGDDLAPDTTGRHHARAGRPEGEVSRARRGFRPRSFRGLWQGTCSGCAVGLAAARIFRRMVRFGFRQGCSSFCW